MRKTFIFISIVFLKCFEINAQCCAAGGGCSLAGAASMGVFQEHQLDLNVNYQFVSTTKFQNGDSPDKNFLDSYSSKYAYYKLGYGITKNFTLSLEAGYYFDKRQIGLNKRDTITTKGWADIVVFPRYDIFNKSSATRHSEITIGLGIKVPVGNAEDRLKQIEPFTGTIYYILKPVAIRTTTGAQDFIYYLSLLRSYKSNAFRIFTNMLYVKKGWNSLGEKAGDYASIGLYASKTIFKNLNVTLQLKGEWIDKMKTNNALALSGYYNYDPEATGSKKILIVPQLSYSYNSFSFFVSSDFPLYQYVNKQQIASQYFVTTGITFSITALKPKVAIGMYYCPMHPEQTSPNKGTCPICEMDLELKK